MSMSESSVIKNIIHHGTVCLAPELVESDGKTFRFLFEACSPEADEWNFRMLRGNGESAELRDERLSKLLERHSSLRAIHDEIPGHDVGLLTVFVPRDGGGFQKESGEAEIGPELLFSLKDPAAGILPPTPPQASPPPAPSVPDDILFPS